MSLEYRLQFSVPENYDPAALFKKLPSPIERSSMTEIYNYRIERDGFYFIDHLVNDAVAAVAFKQFVNEALRLSEQVQLLEPCHLRAQLETGSYRPQPVRRVEIPKPDGRMELVRTTEDHLLAVQAELAALEPIFHHPELGTTREAYEAMTEVSFWEVGASGRRYSREHVIEILLERYAASYVEGWETRDFCCQELAQGLYLLTYTLAQEKRITRRATLWRRASAGWKIVYHQGTIVEQP